MDKQYKMNQVHLIPTAGLCNRMRSIASAVHIAKKLNRPLRIFWNQYEGLNAKFSDLFQPIPVEKTFVEDTQKWKYRINYRKDYLLRRIFLMNYTQVLYNISVQNEKNIFSKIKDKRGDLLLISCFDMSEMYPLRQIFIPTPEIQGMIDEMTRQFTNHTIGIHIRRTDNTMSIRESPISSFVEFMEREIEKDAKVTFYIASDDKEVKEFMQNKFSHRVLFSNIELSRSSLLGMKMAVSELFALSKTTKILGSYYSSYSQIAAELGGIPIQYVLQQN